MKRLMKKNLFFAFILILVIYSCAKGYGTTFIKNNLTIYYNNEKELNVVRKLADYWFSHELISEKPQTIRFLHSDSISQVQLIKKPTFNAESMDFESIKNLQALEDDLNLRVFSKNKVDVVICDSRFNVVNDLNY
jgi:hypothetical protein